MDPKENPMPDKNEQPTYEFECAPWLPQMESTYTKEQAQRIREALVLAMQAHEGQMRRSGDPYISHPCAVAKILMDYGMDAETVTASLLHDVVEDTQVTSGQLAEKFGKTIASLVEGVTKISKLDFRSKADRQAESLRKMLLAMAQDVRVIIIKMADRLHNMRTLYAMTEEKQKEISKETLEIYSPIAGRLGMYAIRSELEDLSLKYLDPEQYAYIEKEIERIRPVQRDFLRMQMQQIKEHLNEMDIECELQGREKHIYSIYRKMIQQGRKPDEIYDFMAMRIIVDTVRDCYAALGIVHTMYKPIPGRFKDFIAMPKSNLYQSLHTTVINRSGILFEVQIRTHEMHKTAEYGVAAHWMYKEGTEQIDKFDKQMLSFLSELQTLQNDAPDPHDFLDTVRLDMFTDEVFVFTPKGEVISLVRGATPIDFAYRIHSRVGDTCIGSRINGRIMPLDTELNTGDVVEILTRKDGHPSRDWLNICKTNNAKNRIRAWFKREFKTENIAKGREMLEREARRQGYDLFTDLMKPEWLEIVFQKYTFHNVDDMYSAIGFGGVSTSQVLQRLIDEYVKATREEKLTAVKEKAAVSVSQDAKAKVTTSKGVIVKGQENMLVRLAHCCNPVPGDAIVGFITRGRGVSVHRSDCSNLKGMVEDDEGRWIEVSWANADKDGYRSSIRLLTVDKIGIMAELSRILSNMNVGIVGVQGRAVKGQFHVDFDVAVKDTEQLEFVIRQFRRVPEVIEVFRGTM